MHNTRQTVDKSWYTILLMMGMGLMIPCYLFTAGNVLFSPWALYNRNHIALALLTAACAGLLLVLFHLAKRHEAFFARREKRVLSLFILFYFAVQMAMGHLLRFTPITDAEQCYTAAQLLVDAGTFGSNERSWNYFTRCTNNLGFVYFYAAIFRFFGLFGWGDRFMQLVLINSLLFSLGLLSGARVVRRIGGTVSQTRFLMLTALCLPLLYCTTELYTDSFSIAFPPMIIYCAMRVMEAGTPQGKKPLSFAQHSALLWIILFSLLSFIGAQIRFTAIIASIACLIAMLLSRKWLRGALTAGALVLAMLMGGALVDAENAKHLDPQDMERRAHPILHYIAMGLPIHEDMGYGQYGDGGWYIFTTSFEDPDERRAALMEEIIDRVYYLRYPNRLLNMMSRKNLSTFGNGTFVLNEIIEADEHEADNPVKQVIFSEGALYPAYYHVTTAMFIAQMIVACIACAQALMRRDTRGAPVFIALVGAFLLLCIWETRGRYFFQFEMLLLCAGALMGTEKHRRKRATVNGTIRSMESAYLEKSLDLVQAVFTAHENEAEGKLVRALAEEIRSKRYYLPELELIMTDAADEVIGYVMFSRFHLEGKYENELLLLSPAAVKTELQRRHISKDLIEYGFERAREMGFKAVIVEGDPRNYRARGFVTSADHDIVAGKNIHLPAVECLMVKELVPGALEGIKGTVDYGMYETLS